VCLKLSRRQTNVRFRYDLIDLQLFICVAEASNITKGARRSNMSLAAASERIREMEATLGTDLLVRGRRGVELTAPGSILLQHARTVSEQLQQMRGELDGYAKGLRGNVRMLVNTVAMLEYVPALLPAFLTRQTNIDVDLEEAKSPDIMRAVAAGRADIGIVAGAIEAEMRLETFPFAQNVLVLIAPKQHPLARKSQVSFADTLNYEYVGLDNASALQTFVRRQAERLGRQLKVRVRLSSFDVICQMVGAGTGLAIVPRASAQRWRRIASFSIVPLADDWVVRHLTLCVRSLESATPHARKLLTYLREHGPARPPKRSADGRSRPWPKNK
jgi:DNA-binding transcriptional LysR family regulator